MRFVRRVALQKATHDDGVRDESLVMTAPSSPSLSTPPSAPLTAVADSEAVASAALEVVRECALEAVNRQGVFRMALSGGRTPQALYTLLADETQLPWDHTDICFGDERLVPPDHPESNYGNARVLLDRPFVDPQRIYRMRGEISGPLAALEYERTLRGIFLDRPWPVFDLILLGLGADGHTASLFPHSAAVLETKLWVVSHYVDKLHAERLTLTLPVLNHARTMVVLVAGEDKSEALQQMLEVSGPTEDVPARGIMKSGANVRVIADAGAVRRLARVNKR